jgi:PAS domain S-box-containing protein
MRAVRQFLRAHRVPLIAVALAALHSLLFWSLGPRVPLGLFLAAVMVSAWHGGVRPAIFATVVSVLFLAVIAHYQTPGPEEDLVLRLGLFVLVGLIAGYLSQQCRQAIRAVEQVHDILGGSGIALISADAEGRVTSLNPLARTITGLGETNISGQSLEQVFHVVHGPKRQAVPLPTAGTTQELPEGTLLLGAHGAETAVEGSVGPVRDGEGRPAGVMVVFREAGGRTGDWQELRQRADRFRALAGYAPTGLMVLDAEGRCVFSNPAAQAACGCTADESLGEGWSRHVQPQDRDRLIGNWLHAIVVRQSFADEFRVVTGLGAERWLRLHSAPMLADSGKVLGHVAALEEVTARRLAEAALADARRESEEHLQEWAAAEKKAEAALQTARAEAEEAARQAHRQLDERGTALRRAEEALAAARAEAEQQLHEAASQQQRIEEALGAARVQAQQQLREAASQRQQAEDALTQARAQFEKALAEALAGRQHAEEELGRLREEVGRLSAQPRPGKDETGGVREAWGEEVATVVAMHLDARARLAEELLGHRDAHARLRSVVAEKDGTAESLRTELARLEQEADATRMAHDQLQSLLAERGGSEESLRKELERLGEDAAGLRQSHDRLNALLAQKDGTEESLRQELERLTREAEEARKGQDGIRESLAEKAKTETVLRQDLERLQGEAAARRQAEEAHERLQTQLEERGQREVTLRREKEFLEGVIDGSPAGIFAHGRDGRCRVWNAALERLLGRPRSDALGRTAAELFPPTEGHGPDANEERPASEHTAIRTGLSAGAVLGRSEFFESVHAPIHDPAGEVVGGMTLVRVLPRPARQDDFAAENGTTRHNNGVLSPRPARLGDIDWLAFN